MMCSLQQNINRRRGPFRLKKINKNQSRIEKTQIESGKAPRQGGTLGGPTRVMFGADKIHQDDHPGDRICCAGCVGGNQNAQHAAERIGFYQAFHLFERHDSAD